MGTSVFAVLFIVAGQFLYDELRPALRLDAAIPPSLEGEERQAFFLSFVSHMLTWLPEERKTARELMEHPFLKFENRQVASYYRTSKEYVSLVISFATYLEAFTYLSAQRVLKPKNSSVKPWR